jgi:hypothetical protein
MATCVASTLSLMFSFKQHTLEVMMQGAQHSTIGCTIMQ